MSRPGELPHPHSAIQIPKPVVCSICPSWDAHSYFGDLFRTARHDTSKNTEKKRLPTGPVTTISMYYSI